MALQNDHHLIPWLKAKFNIEISQSLFGPADSRYHACKGDYDLDVPSAMGASIFGAAAEYAVCHDETLANEFETIELGE